MPSPFPGMDPFLEHPSLFPDLHDRLITYLSEELNRSLPQPYYAGIAARVWVEQSGRSIEPDVRVQRPRESNGSAGGGRGASEGGVALAEAVGAKPVLVYAPLVERREPFVEIYDGSGEGRLVTAVEVLSPSNKAPGDHGQGLYQRKQDELLHGSVHLIEIDLLRGGEHTVAAPRNLAVARVGHFDYLICTHLSNSFGEFLIYPVRLEDRLPRIAVPLLPGAGAVAVELQPLLDRCYDAGRYAQRVRYNSAPVPPLTAEQDGWARGVLREKGLGGATT